MAAAMLAPTLLTSTPSTFREFLIAPNDHYTGNYTALMLNFAIDGAAVVATPATVRAQVVEATAQQVAFVNGKLQPFFLPFTIKPALGMAEDASIHNKVHAFWGELIQGAATLVHLPDDVVNLANQVQVPTLMSAKILLAANATLTTFGPYAVGDLDTKIVRTRKPQGLYHACKVSGILPITQAQGWGGATSILGGDASGYRSRWQRHRPQTLHNLHHLIHDQDRRQGGQGSGPSDVLAAAPAPVARNTTLVLTHSQILLHSHLTGLGKHGGGGMNLALLISAINDGHSQAAIRANDKRQERKAKEVKTVESMLGKGQGPSSPPSPPLWCCNGS